MKLSHIFKVILLLLLPFFLLAQYPNNPIKSRLGWQTTGDGLIYRGAGAPTYSPGTLFNAWMYLDTTNYALYMYRNFQWTKLPLVNNGLTLDGSYVQLGGTLVENTTVERSTYTLDLGKKSGSNNGYLSFYGTDPHYVGALTTKDGTESGLTIGNKLWSFEVDDSDHVSTLTGSRFGFDATYLGTLGVSQFKMDSTRFYIRGLPTYATHAAADADLDTYGMYQITDGRAIYARTGSADKVSPNIQDNGTAVSILNSKPFQLGQWTTAGRPSGTAGYMGWRDGTTLEWYNGTRWATGLESTFARGTATYFPYFDANGQVANSILAQSGTEISVTSSTGILKIDGNNGTNTGQIFFKTGAGDYSNWIGTQDYNMTLRTRTTSQKIVMEFGSAARAFEFRGGGSGNMLILASTNLDLSGINSITSPSFVPLLLYSDLAGSDQTGLISRRSTRTSDVTQPDRPIHSFQYGTAERARITIAGQLSLGGSAPDASSIVDVVSTTRGFLMPRMSTTQRNAITSPASTLLLANTDSLFYEARISGAWKGIAFRDWVRSNFIGSASTLYGGNGTIGASRIATLTDSLRLQFGGSDLLKLKSNGVLHVNMPTEASSFVITSTPSENYENYRGQVFLTGTTSAGDTATGTRRNNHEASFFSGINLVEGGNNVYYDAVSGYGNVVRGNQPKNIVYGTYNTVNSGSDNGAYGFGINITGSQVTVFGRSTTVTGDNITAIGRGNTITQSNSFIYGSNISGGTNLTQHGFGTVTPSARVHVKALSGAPTILADGGTVVFNAYGTPATTAAALSKTESNYNAGFATDGTIVGREQKRDTTVYITDTDLDWSAAITTAQISRRYNRVIFLMTTTGAAGSNSDLTLHTPDINLMQVEYLIRSTDETGGFTNTIQFGSNNAVASDNALASSYTPSAGQGVGIRAGLRSGTYKYWYY